MTTSPAHLPVAPLEFSSYAEALGWLDGEHANLVAAIGQAAALGLHEIAWQLPITLWDLFSLRGHMNDWISSHQIGLASARALGDQNAEQWLLNPNGGRT